MSYIYWLSIHRQLSLSCETVKMSCESVLRSLDFTVIFFYKKQQFKTLNIFLLSTQMSLYDF